MMQDAAIKITIFLVVCAIVAITWLYIGMLMHDIDTLKSDIIRLERMIENSEYLANHSTSNTEKGE